VIDPLAAILQYLRNDNELNALVAGRIAAKHKFAMESASHLGWPVPSRALQVQLEAGATPDLYGGTQRIRLQCRCFGQRQQDAMLVYHALRRLTLQTERTVIALPDNQNALLYYLYQDSAPILLIDPDTKIDVVLIYLNSSLSNCSIEVSL
jgi:hypothetical protein